MLMRLNHIEPNFFIIGAAKAATTSLASLLMQHEEAAIVQGKEPHFFSYDHRYSAGWKSYLTLYEHCTNQKAIGDASTSYSRIRYHPNVIKRIKLHIPDAKIIYMVRHPLERMESAYIELMASPGSITFKSISDAVIKQPMIIDSSRYWEVFDAYRNSFSEEKIKVVWFEEYSKNTLVVFQDVCRFLNIDDSFIPVTAHEQMNSRADVLNRLQRLGRDTRSINTIWEPQIRQKVINAIRDDNLKFLRYFGKPEDFWGNLFY